MLWVNLPNWFTIHMNCLHLVRVRDLDLSISRTALI